MRLRHPGGRLVHLSYGSNVHPARDLTEIIEHLDTYAAAIRARLDVDTLAVSLWLPPASAAALAIDARSRARLRSELTARGLEVVTLSAKPYRAGEAGSTSHHRPDWTRTERLEYTLDLARVLVDLLPDDAVRGSISSIGLGRRAGWGSDQQRDAARILGRLSAGLAEIAWSTGRAVRVGLQPEPGGVLDGAAATVAALDGVDKDRIGVCLDLGSLACTWQDPTEAIQQLTAAGLSVVKVQVTTAIEVASPAAAAETLRGYVDQHHQHQVRTPSGWYADDLGQALRDFPAGPWRVRYQVPLHASPAAPLTATTEVWQTALRQLMDAPVPGCEHLDVETETWGAMPPGERATGPAALVEGVTAELSYARQVLQSLGLAPQQRAHAAP